MSTYRPRPRHLVIALALFGAVACGRGAVPLNTTTPVLLQSQQEPDALRAALVRALDARRYTTERELPGQIVARFQHRGQMLRVQIDYGPTEYRISYVESTGMGYVVGRDGQAMISRTYDRHLQQLQRTITDEIGRPEREAQEAADQQREHELAVLEEQRRREREAREDQAREAQRDRNARLEEQRLATARAVAEAEASRPVILNHDAYVVDSMQAQPRRRIRARFGTVRITGRVRTQWVSGQAEGDTDSGSLGLPQSCRGFYAGNPEHVLRVRGDVDYLRLETDADGDPTLMLVAEDGAVYCDDDGGEGLNSRIEGSFPPGTYRVYVGSYQPNRSDSYRLLITAEHAAARARPARTRAPRQGPRRPAARDCASLVVQHGHSPAQTMHCQGAEPRCAAALLAAGHNPAQLLHCARA